MGSEMCIRDSDVLGTPDSSLPITNPELWAIGLRNPYGLNFDAGTGDLWIPDVGNGQVEEVNRQQAASTGLNYGWPCFEGLLNGPGGSSQYCPLPSPQEMIYYTYAHNGLSLDDSCMVDDLDGGAAVLGGFVYRGTSISFAETRYIYGDFASNEIYSIPALLAGQVDDSQRINHTIDLSWCMECNRNQNKQLLAIGSDSEGEILLVCIDRSPGANNVGTIYRVEEE